MIRFASPKICCHAWRSLARKRPLHDHRVDGVGRSVLDIKERNECRYLICDGGRTNHALTADHIRSVLLPFEPRPGRSRLTTVCGPTCMTDDVLGRFELPEGIISIVFRAEMDVIVALTACAAEMSNNYRFKPIDFEVSG